MAVETVKIPDLGGADDVEVIEVSVSVGDVVDVEDSLVVLETDKASMDVPSTAAGKVVAVHVNEGDKVNVGDICVDIEIEGESIATEAQATNVEAPQAQETASVAAKAEPAVVTNAAPVAIDVAVPDLGGAENVDVIETCVAVGDSVAEGDSLIVLETDKASMDVPATHAGVVIEVLVAEGDKVNEGSVIVRLETSDVSGAEVAPTESSASESSVAKAPPAETSVAPVTSQNNLLVPDIGGSENVDVIEVCVKPGDVVAEGDSLIVLETDKASMDVPSEFSGTIVSVAIEEGGKVNEGDVIGVIEVQSQGSTASPEAATPIAASEARPVAKPTTAKLPPAATEAGESHRDVHAGPAVRKLARELGVTLERVKGSGPRGRILKDDLHDYVKNAMKQVESGAVSAPSVSSGTGLPPRPSIDFSQFGDVETVALNKIDRLTAANMQRSWLNVPHVTQFDDADITDLEEFRKGLKAEGEKRGVKVTPVAFLVKAVASALSQNPKFNASLDSTMENRIFKKYVNVGMAVDTPRGLVVPVIKDADKKGLWDIAAEVIELSTKARDGKLKPNEMQGGCFTISSLGAIGGTGFTPIVNTPEVGILGVSKAQIKPVWNGSEFVPRQMLPLALSYDHCAINGGDAGRFLTTVVAELSDIRRLILS